MATETSTEETPKQTPKKGTTPTSSQGIGIAALIVGIVAFLSGLVPVWGLLVGVAAIVLGAIALKKSKANKGFGIAGIVLGAVGALTSLVFSAIWVFGLIALGTAATVSGGSLSELSKAVDAVKTGYTAQDAIAKKQIDAKKDFNKGDTADFGTFSVKVNSVNANYTPTDGSVADSGSKYVLVNLTVSNPNEKDVDVSSSTFDLSADGVTNSNGYVTVDSAFKGGTLAKGASSTGNLVFTVPTTASSLKLTYKTTAIVINPYQMKELTYTISL